MKTEDILLNYGNDLFFFILKRVKKKQECDDIFQNVFEKIHKKIETLQDPLKVKNWAFQITRNEIANYFNNKTHLTQKNKDTFQEDNFSINNICCFDKAIKSLPQKYKLTIEEIYINGLKQKEAAIKLEISLANVKVRIRRGKQLIKEYLKRCCKYKLNDKGYLSGENNCSTCN